MLLSVLLVAIGVGVCDAEALQRRSSQSAGLPEWRLEVDQLIGDSGSVPIGRVGALQADASGTIFVFDDADATLRVFDTAGRARRTFGRRGAGPGEFQGVIGMAIAPAGQLWIVDGVNARYTVVDGERHRDFRRPSALYRLPWFGGFSAGLMHDPVALAGREGEFLLRVTADGIPTDTVPVPLPALPVPRRRSMSFPLPYAAGPLRAFDGAGFVWVANTHEYRIARVSTSGDTTALIERDVPRVELDQRQRDSLERYIRALESQAGIEVTAAMRPRTQAVLNWFVVDDVGRLWVNVPVAGGRPRFDVFDARGRPLASVVPPFDMVEVLPVVRGSVLYAVTEAEDGSQRVVRARIRR